MKANIQLLTLCMTLWSLLAAATLRAEVLVNTTPYTLQITLHTSDTAPEQSITIEPHMQKEIGSGKFSIELFYKNTVGKWSLLASTHLPTSVTAAGDVFRTRLGIQRFYFICDQPIGTDGHLSNGKILIYAQTGSGHTRNGHYLPAEFVVVAETQPFSFPITSQAN